MHPQVVTDYITRELSLGRLLGPFSCQMQHQLHVNRVGIIPKGRNTGKWRLITDLSYPNGRSVNDNNDPTFCSLIYMTIDDVADILLKMGRGAQLDKIDIVSAYCLILVHPEDCSLQAIRRGQ